MKTPCLLQLKMAAALRVIESRMDELALSATERTAVQEAIQALPEIQEQHQLCQELLPWALLATADD